MREREIHEDVPLSHVPWGQVYPSLKASILSHGFPRLFKNKLVKSKTETRTQWVMLKQHVTSSEVIKWLKLFVLCIVLATHNWSIIKPSANIMSGWRGVAVKEVTSMQLMLWGRLPLRFWNMCEITEKKVEGFCLLFKEKDRNLATALWEPPPPTPSLSVPTTLSASAAQQHLVLVSWSKKFLRTLWERVSELLPGVSRIAQHLINFLFLFLLARKPTVATALWQNHLVGIKYKIIKASY